MKFAEAVKRAYLGRVSLSATGFYATPKLNWDKDRMCAALFIILPMVRRCQR